MNIVINVIAHLIFCRRMEMLRINNSVQTCCLNEQPNIHLQFDKKMPLKSSSHSIWTRQYIFLCAVDQGAVHWWPTMLVQWPRKMSKMIRELGRNARAFQCTGGRDRYCPVHKNLKMNPNFLVRFSLKTTMGNYITIHSTAHHNNTSSTRIKTVGIAAV